MYFSVNVTAFLDTNAIIWGEKKAVVFPKKGEEYTYRDLLSLTNSAANGLKELGAKKGDRIGMSLDNSPEFLIGYFAIWRIGAICVPINPNFKKEELLSILRDAEVKLLITNKVVYDKIADEIEDIIVVTSLSKLLKNKKEFQAENCSLNDVCTIQYTSGTTTTPKGAMLTHGNWLAAIENEIWVLQLSEEDVYLGFYPMFHVGLSWGIAALKAGATFVIMDRFELEEYLELAEKYKATVLAGMPPVIHRLVNSPPGIEEKLRYAKVIISGGGPLAESIWKKFDERFKIPIANAYGLSETIVVGTATSTTPRLPYTLNFKSVGVPIGYTEVKIVDENNPSKELKPGEIGEIALRGPGVAKGYWKRDEESKKVFLPDGWFLTGDMGYLDEQGLLYITDRKKDMIIMSGWKIYPTEVENVILQHPEVKDTAVFAREDEMRGEIPVAVVVLKEGSNVSKEEIIAFCRERLANYKVPRDVIFADSIPRVHGWKLLRRLLREKYAKGN